MLFTFKAAIYPGAQPTSSKSWTLVIKEYLEGREITDPYFGRHPYFATLNFRVDYQTQIGGVRMKAFLDIVNAINRNNVDEVSFSEIDGSTESEGLGILPQFGIVFEF